jgi:hypothetical protein
LYFVHFVVYLKIEKYFLLMERFMAWWNPFDWMNSSQKSSQNKEMPRTAPPPDTVLTPPEKPLLSLSDETPRTSSAAPIAPQFLNYDELKKIYQRSGEDQVNIQNLCGTIPIQNSTREQMLGFINKYAPEYSQQTDAFDNKMLTTIGQKLRAAVVAQQELAEGGVKGRNQVTQDAIDAPIKEFKNFLKTQTPLQITEQSPHSIRQTLEYHMADAVMGNHEPLLKYLKEAAAVDTNNEPLNSYLDSLDLTTTEDRIELIALARAFQTDLAEHDLKTSVGALTQRFTVPPCTVADIDGQYTVPPCTLADIDGQYNRYYGKPSAALTALGRNSNAVTPNTAEVLGAMFALRDEVGKVGIKLDRNPIDNKITELLDKSSLSSDSEKINLRTSNPNDFRQAAQEAANIYVSYAGAMAATRNLVHA